MTPTENPNHPRNIVLRVALITWLLLISGAVVVNHVTLSKVVEHSNDNASAAEVALLEQQIAELIAWVAEQDQPQPPVLLEARYESEHKLQNQHLAALTQALGERAMASDVQSLQQRIESLEKRPVTTRPSSITASRPRVSSPKPIEPPFQVVGIELRADEQFLVILPTGANTLAQAHLLRRGESIGDWHLEAIEGSEAVFQKGNQSRRMVIPARQEKP